MYDRITLNEDISRIFIEIWEISTYNPGVRDKLKTAYNNWIWTVSQLIEAQCRDKATARLISATLVAFLEGLSMFSVMFDKTEFPLDQIL